MQTFYKIFLLLTPHERKQAAFLLIMIIIMALLDTIGVASIVPFMAVLSNPDIIYKNDFLNNIFHISGVFGVETNQQFLLFLGILFFFLLIISLMFKTFVAYAQTRFIQMRVFSLSKRLVEKYLHQPYSWFLNQHSANIGKTILSEVDQVISNGINPLIELIAKSIVAIALISLLIFSNPKLTAIIGLTLSVTYLIIYLFVRGYLIKFGHERLRTNELRFKIVNEAFTGIKTVKVSQLEKKYIESFSNASLIFAKTKTASVVISQLPRYILEAIAFGGILLIIIYHISKMNGFNYLLPILSLYIFAGYRLMPALQQIYSSFTQLTFTGPALDKLYKDLVLLQPNKINFNGVNLPFERSITLEKIYFSYPNSEKIILNNLNLIISNKSTIGLIGPTGSGKTTLVDIILGLLKPQQGTIKVDDKIITENNLSSLQRFIGYVPQNIYLSDDTIFANIGLGIESKFIDLTMVKEASKIANIHDFIINELPEKYDTKVGEQGIRLSGGQRQRIGIARALYHKPKLLILDEATSALDNSTEKAIIDAVDSLKSNITIIIIAHRLNTLKKCDKIYKFEKGKLIDMGIYSDLI